MNVGLHIEMQSQEFISVSDVAWGRVHFCNDCEKNASSKIGI